MYPSKASTVTAFQRIVGDNYSNAEERNIPFSKMKYVPGTNRVSLAMDGSKILDAITKAVREDNKVAAYTVSTPLAVYENIVTYGEMSKALEEYFLKTNGAEFKPVYVFDGCGFSPMLDLRKNPPAQPCEEVLHCDVCTTQHPVSALSADAANQCAARFTIEDDVEAVIVRRMRDGCEDTFRAPYIGWSQISGFFAPSNQYVSEVYGSVELLAFPGIDRVITNIDVEKKTFDCISKASLLALARKKYRDFSEADLSSILLCESKNKHFSIAGMPDFCEELMRMGVNPQQGRDDWSRVAALLDDSNRFNFEQKLRLRRNLAALDAPVLHQDGKCVSLSALYQLPKRSHIAEYFGRPMPFLFYYFVMSGPVMPGPFSVVGQDTIEDDWPLVDTATYRSTAEIILPLRVQTVYQLRNYIYPRYKNEIRWMRQYLFTKTQENDSRIAPIFDPPPISLASWDIVATEKVTAEDGEVYISNVLPFTGCASDKAIIYRDVKMTVAVTLLKSLDLLGYFTHSAEAPECSGPSIYSAALEKFTCATLSEYGVLVIELVRTGALGREIPVLALNAGAADRYPKHIWLAATILSVIPLNTNSAWSGPFDPSIAAFGTVTRMFGSTLRSLMECVASLIFATKTTEVPVEEYHKVISGLPFAIPVEFNAGFLVCFILMNPGCTVEDLTATFPELYSLRDDIVTLFWFWTMAFDAISVLINSFSNEEQNDPGIDLKALEEANNAISQACYRLTPELWNDLYQKTAVAQPLYAPNNSFQVPPNAHHQHQHQHQQQHQQQQQYHQQQQQYHQQMPLQYNSMQSYQHQHGGPHGGYQNMQYGLGA